MFNPKINPMKTLLICLLIVVGGLIALFGSPMVEYVTDRPTSPTWLITVIDTTPGFSPTVSVFRDSTTKGWRELYSDKIVRFERVCQ